MKTRKLVWGLSILWMAIGTLLQAAEIHVAPDASPGGNGSKEKPYTLKEVFADEKGAMVKPGDTVILRGGQYDGDIKKEKNKEGGDVVNRIPFSPKLKGTESSPIIVTSAPGEWAHLNGSVDIDGCDHTHFVRLEIGDLDWDLYQEKHKNQTAFNAIRGVGLKLINCNVFGGAMGTGLWTPAMNFEAYGNLVHDFGYLKREGGRGHGHAFYMQNLEGTKVIEQNIAYRSCGWLYDIYTQKGEIQGFDILDNIGYLGGWYQKGQVSFALGLTGWKVASRIRFIGNIAYQPRDEQQFRGNLRMMYHKYGEQTSTIVHDTGLVKDNYVMGAYRGMVFSEWKNLEITGNTVWSTGILTEISSAPGGSGAGSNPPAPNLQGFKLHGNTYIANGKEKPFVYGCTEEVKEEEYLSFEEWQKLGLDKDSKIIPGKDGKPTGEKAFVFANKYEKGRANVAIFNWDGKDKVDVDLSPALAKGQAYSVYNCFDIKQTITLAKPVLSGTFDGAPVAFPMKKDPDSPVFDAFLVIPSK